MADEKRLIDANELTETLSSLIVFFNGLRFGKTALYRYAEDYQKEVLRLVDEAPTVDAVEVVHGRWKNEGKVCACSCCMQQFNGFLAPNWKYCPNCGAKMDGGNEDGNT